MDAGFVVPDASRSNGFHLGSSPKSALQKLEKNGVVDARYHEENDLDDLAHLSFHHAEPEAEVAAEEDSNGVQKLPQENDEGNVEYKRKLVNPSPERLEHLTSQLKFRLAEGCGECLYEIGVEDDGVGTGLSAEELQESINTLKHMAAKLNADTSVIRTRDGISGTVAEVLVRRYAAEEFFEVRVAVVGNVDSGKSTLLGVLTRGQLDNGRGLARSHVFLHRHEMESGRTSSISSQILGFDSKGRIVNTAGLKGMSTMEICEASAKIINFIDLAGHEKYLKTTMFGLTGHAPDFAMLMVGANMGVSQMSKEHLGISLALRVPVFVVVTKIDLCPENILKETMLQIKKVLKSPGCKKIPIVIRSEDDVVVSARNFVSDRIAPIFCVSNVSGKNLDLLKQFLNLLPARTDWEQMSKLPTEFHIDATWSVPGVGAVVSGTLMKGVIDLNQNLLLGPDEFSKFVSVSVKSMQTKRMPVRTVRAGQTASIALRKVTRASLRKGMVLLAPALKPRACREFDAEVLILYHSTTIAPNYQAVLHCGVAQQTVKLLTMDKEYIRTGDKAKCRFKFMHRAEWLSEGSRLIFREGRTKGIGKVVRVVPEEEEIRDIVRPKKVGGKYDMPDEAAPASTPAAASAPAGTATAAAGAHPPGSTTSHNGHPPAAAAHNGHPPAAHAATHHPPAAHGHGHHVADKHGADKHGADKHGADKHAHKFHAHGTAAGHHGSSTAAPTEHTSPSKSASAAGKGKEKADEKHGKREHKGDNPPKKR